MSPSVRWIVTVFLLVAVLSKARGQNEKVGSSGIPTHASDGSVLTDEQKEALQDFYDKVEGIFGSQGPTDSGSHLNEICEPFDSYECVPYFQCGPDGVIVSDGAGLIDVRIRPQANCINKEYPDVPALCCLIPGARPYLRPCDGISECVDPYQCNNNGEIITDGGGLIDIRVGQHQKCYQYNDAEGVCCYPPKPPVLEYCPINSVCVVHHECRGQAFTDTELFSDYGSTGSWLECSLQHGNTGVCCKQPIIDYCPSDSLCVPYGDCIGTAINRLGEFVQYDAFGTFSDCNLGSEYTDTGVCCISEKILVPATQCGVRNYHLDKRIQSASYANNEAAFGEFPWQSIIFFQNFTFKCGASLISDRHVLTAAHCVYGYGPHDLRLRFGDWQVNAFDEPFPYVDRNVYKIDIHPHYNPKNVHNDIAVLELIEPVSLDYHVNTICLPAPHERPYDKQDCFASGWGKDSFLGTFQVILKKIALPFVEHDRCQGLLRKTRLGRFFRLDKSFVCAGGKPNEDACYGDGGGPLVCKADDGRYILAGITSWGIGCGTEHVPGVYADVTNFSHWVDDIVKRVNPDQNYAPVSNYGK